MKKVTRFPKWGKITLKHILVTFFKSFFNFPCTEKGQNNLLWQSDQNRLIVIASFPDKVATLKLAFGPKRAILVTLKPKMEQIELLQATKKSQICLLMMKNWFLCRQILIYWKPSIGMCERRNNFKLCVIPSLHLLTSGLHTTSKWFHLTMKIHSFLVLSSASGSSPSLY